MGFPHAGRRAFGDQLLLARARRGKLRRDQAERVVALAVVAGVGGVALEALDAWREKFAPVDEQGEFLFVAHERDSLPAIVRWLRLNSMCPLVAPEIYATMCSLIVDADGRVNATSAELARMIGVSVSTITRVLVELGEGDDDRPGLRVVARKREGRSWVFYITPYVASRAPRDLHRAACARVERPLPLLSLMEGGRE